MARIATGSPCTAAHRIGDAVGHADGRFGGISNGTAGSVRGEDILRFVPAAIGMPRPRPSASERGAWGCLAK
jgi:hypothetical protein